MNKKQFLDLLEKKLSVLEENEKEDIIIEYTDTINEKIKKGQTEEEAVKDFGDIDDLTKEILKAYKINPNYEDKKDNLGKKGEDLIKQSTEALSNFSRKVAQKCNIKSSDINLEFIIDIIIRIFIVLIAMLILKGVLTIFNNIGESIFGNFYSPIGPVAMLFWKIILFVIFIIVTVLMVIALFKKYFKIDGRETENINEKEAKTKERTNKQNLNNKPKKQVKQNKNTTLGDVCLLIVKIFVIIYIIIPFIFIDALIILGLILSIIYLIKGINLIGLVLLLLGLGSLFTYLIKIIFSLLFGKGKASIIPIIISIVLMIIGIILFIDMIINIEYIEKLPDEKEQITEAKTFNINKNAYIHFTNSYNSELKEVIDEQMPDGQFKIELKYNKNYHDYKIEEDQNYLMNDCEYNYEIDYYEYEDEYEEYQECTQSTYYYLDISDESNYSGFNEFKENYKKIIEDLKSGKIYNNEKLYESQLIITANQKTLDMIKTNQ